jgi:Fe-S cluster assembly iron-binding protein IscA
MQCKITRNAAKMLLKEMEGEENQELKLRVHITHSHGDHAHYGLGLDTPTDEDVVVETDKGIDVILKKDEPLLDGVKIDYLYVPEEGFVITNPSKGNHGDH